MTNRTKRAFLATLGGTGLLPWAAARADGTAPQPGLLTVTGAIGRSNRGPFDPVLDQMMGKHGVQFERAYEFDAITLQRLPAVSIKPTLEYDGKRHTLDGPLLTTVLDAVGAAGAQLALRAVDGYNVALSRADAAAYKMMVALKIDGRPLALGGFGPQWAVYDADNLAAFKDKPLKERFALCPWGLYHVAVIAA